MTSFNPRTRMGCDPQSILSRSCLGCFNPRTRMGCDQLCDEGLIITEVSIHAPAWGATVCHTCHRELHKFQSTHPHGVRRKNGQPRAEDEGFNPRTRMGCDKTRGHQRRKQHCFNPRTRMGCDRYEQVYNRTVLVSIHAPAWGATAHK